MRVAPNSVVEELKFRSPDGIEAVARIPHGYSTTRASVISREWTCSGLDPDSP